MIAYTADDQFSPSDIYDTSDSVRGGLDGASNAPIKALLNRTVFLFNRMGRYEDVKHVSGNYTYAPEDSRKFFVFSIVENSTFILPDPSSLSVGSKLNIRTRYAAVKALKVQCGAGKIFGDDDVAVDFMYMHAGERLHLVADRDHWEVSLADGNYYTAGQEVAAMKVRRNTVIANGAMFNRADMPRLAAFGQSLPNGGGIVADSVWLSDPGGVPYYRGMYSYGNGVSDMRLPEKRGTFDRYIDLGRGLDNDRFPNAVGGYEADVIKSHSLSVENMSRRGYPDDSAGRTNTSYYFLDKDRDTAVNYKPLAVSYVGAAETRPKNTGKLPLVYF